MRLGVAVAVGLGLLGGVSPLSAQGTVPSIPARAFAHNPTPHVTGFGLVRPDRAIAALAPSGPSVAVARVCWTADLLRAPNGRTSATINLRSVP